MTYDLSCAQWRKSRYSGNTGNCVEVAITGSVIGVRDSKNPTGLVLVFTHDEWRTFLRDVKAREFEV